MNRKRSIRDFFTTVSTKSIDQHVQDDTSDGDEIVVASRATTPANPQKPSRKPVKNVKSQSPVAKTRLHASPTGRNNEKATDIDKNTRPSSLSSRTLSTPARTPNRSHAVGQLSSRTRFDDNLSSRSLVPGPVKLPLRSPRSTSSRYQIEFNDHPTTKRDRTSMDMNVDPETSAQLMECETGHLVGKRILTAVSIPLLASARSEKHVDHDQQSPSSGLSSGSGRSSLTRPEAASFPSAVDISRGPVSRQSSSRRVLRNGLQAVTNSDSEGGGDSSEEDLGDVSVFIPHKRKRPSPPEENVNLRRSKKSSEPTRKSSRLAEPEVERTPQQSFTPSPPRAVYKHSLANMVAQMQKSKQVEARITILENEIAEAQRIGQETDPDRPDDEIDPQMLATAGGSDSDERERVLQALSREKVSKGEGGYHFFLDRVPLSDDAPFPIASLPIGVWPRILTDDLLRAQACVTGLVTDMVARHPLPMEVILWMAQQLAYERNDILCEAYVEIIQASSRHETWASYMMSRLSCFYRTRSLSESLWKGDESPGLPPGISYLVRVISSIAPISDARTTNASPSDTSATVLDFASMLIDERIRKDLGLVTTIMRAAEEALEALSEQSFNALMSDITRVVFGSNEMSPWNRYDLILSLPRDTPRAGRLRRSLALACFTDTTVQPKPTDQNDLTNIITTALLTRPEFAISKSTDYNLLVALIEILDIAVGPDLSSLSTYSPTPPSDSDISSHVGRGSTAETLHNRRVDALALHLRAIASRIREAGPNPFLRAEAKTVIERVVVRLEHGVRTRPKPWSGAFGARNAVQTGLKGFFSGPENRREAGGG